MSALDIDKERGYISELIIEPKLPLIIEKSESIS